MTSENKGLWLGLLGVLMFSATLPMTKLAVGSLEAPQLSPWFVTFGRAAVAGILSIVYLGAVKASRPERKHWGMIAFTAVGVVVGFPLLMALALQSVPSTHGAVVTGLMPLATAIAGALWWRQKPSLIQPHRWPSTGYSLAIILNYAAKKLSSSADATVT